MEAKFVPIVGNSLIFIAVLYSYKVWFYQKDTLHVLD